MLFCSKNFGANWGTFGVVVVDCGCASGSFGFFVFELFWVFNFCWQEEFQFLLFEVFWVFNFYGFPVFGHEEFQFLLFKLFFSTFLGF